MKYINPKQQPKRGFDKLSAFNEKGWEFLISNRKSKKQRDKLISTYLVVFLMQKNQGMSFSILARAFELIPERKGARKIRVVKTIQIVF